MANLMGYNDSDSRNVSWRRNKGPGGRWSFRRDRNDGSVVVYLVHDFDAQFPARKTLRGADADLIWAVVEMDGVAKDSDYGIREHLRPMILNWKPPNAELLPLLERRTTATTRTTSATGG